MAVGIILFAVTIDVDACYVVPVTHVHSHCSLPIRATVTIVCLCHFRST